MKVLAIGATGFIGPHIVRRLVAEGHEVAVFHRRNSPVDLPGSVRHIIGNRDHLPEHKTALAAFAPNVVLDVIPYTEQQAATLVDIFEGIAERVVALSSSDVYRNYDGLRGKGTDPPDPVPLSEDAPLRTGLYPYRSMESLAFEHRDDYEKILVERAVTSNPDVPATVLRLPAVYGPGDRQRRFYSHAKRIWDGRPAILLQEEQASWRWTRGYVQNVAAAIVLAVTSPKAAGRVYNVGEPDAPSEAEWVCLLGEVAGWKGEIATLPREQLPAHLRLPFDWRYELATNTSRIRSELGYVEPVSRQEGLRKTVEWERLNPPPESVRAGPFDYAAEDLALSGLPSLTAHVRPCSRVLNGLNPVR